MTRRAAPGAEPDPLRDPAQPGVAEGESLHLDPEPDDDPDPALDSLEPAGEHAWSGGHAYRHSHAAPPGSPPDSIVIAYRVAKEHAGLRLDRFVMLRIPRISRTRAQDIIRSCARRPDGMLRRPSDVVREGETVLLVRPRFDEPDAPLHFGVLHEDDEVLAIDKPSGLPVHPTATYHRHTVTFLLRQRYGSTAPQIAHRLDRETSGVLLCGKTPDAERAMKLQFERRRVKKTYLAITRGELEGDRGTIDLPLSPTKNGLHLLMEVRDEGESSRAETEYEVLARRGGHSLVRLAPRTGRQHQLRVHLAAIGHPIVGDKLYGPEGDAVFRDYIANGLVVDDSLRARLGHDRQALHAHAITLLHPRGALPFTVESPLAPDLQALWATYA